VPVGDKHTSLFCWNLDARKKKVLKQLGTGEKLFWFIWLRFGIMIVNKNFNDRHFILSNRALQKDTHFSSTLVMIFLQRPAKKIRYRSFQFLLTTVILKRNYLIWNNFPLVANLYNFSCCFKTHQTQPRNIQNDLLVIPLHHIEYLLVIPFQTQHLFPE
jgi:hypothetical protein